MAAPGATRVCKVCGIEYPYCHTNIASQYRWQDVACCPEHATQYFAEVAASRSKPVKTITTEFTGLLPKESDEVKETEVKDGSDGFDDAESSATDESKPKRKNRKKQDFFSLT